MKKLFLDDVREAPLGWDTVRSYNEFKNYIETMGVPDVISFDHDLGWEHYPLAEQNPTEHIPYETYKEKTGLHCAQLLVEKGEYPAVAVVHSFNPVGAKNIFDTLYRHMVERIYIQPYGSIAYNRLIRNLNAATL